MPPTTNTLQDRLNELEAIIYGSQAIGGSPAFGVQLTAATKLTGSTDALSFPANYYVASSGVDAMTLATPTAGNPSLGGDDGKCVRIADVGGHAHTITVATNVLVPSHHLVTFGGAAGAFVELEAFGGLWYVKASSGVTPS